MEITTLHGPRYKLALEQLRSGNAVNFRELNIWLDNQQKIMEVRVRSSWDIRNITSLTAASDLEHGKNTFRRLLEESEEFASLIEGYTLDFLLVNDYGSGMVEVARLSGSDVVWAKGIDAT